MKNHQLPAEADAAAGSTTVVKGKPQARPRVPPTPTPTKRQRRQQPNDRQRWPQHPRIRDAAQREAAYLRSAGLGSQSVADAAAAAALPPAAATANATVTSAAAGAAAAEGLDAGLARRLGSTDARTRHRTVLQLGAYLQARSHPAAAGVSEIDLLKVWKCAWYALYLADRAPVQAQLSQQLVRLIHSVAGTPEEDEYAACAYMRMDDDADDDQDSDQDEAMEEPEEEEEEGAEFGPESDVDDDDDEHQVTMEELANTFYGVDGEDDDGSDESDGVGDLEEKQRALLQDDDDEDEEADNVDVGDEADPETNEDDEDDEDDDATVDDATVGHCRGAHLSALLVRTFFRTISREWGRMDKYRVDKFYTCLRDMMREVYTYLARRQWSTGLIRLFNDAVYDEVLSQTPNGVRYHLIDVCLDELVAAAAASATLPLTEAALIDVLEPFFALAQTGAGGDDTIHARVVERVLVKFLDEHCVYSAAHVRRDVTTDAPPPPILDQVHVGTIAKFIFEVASDEGVLKDEYRNNLYAVYKQYTRRMHEFGPEQDVDLEDSDGDDGNEDDAAEGDKDAEDGDFDNAQFDDDIDQFERDEAESSDEEEPPENAVQSNIVKVVAKKKLFSAESTMPKQAATHKVTAPVLEDSIAAVVSSVSKKVKNKKNITREKTDEPPIEEEITITVAEQRAAQSALMKEEDQSSGAVTTNVNKKRTSAALQRREASSEAKKRVKFGDTNRARSWKASMQGLRVVEISPILNATPEKSILLNKGSKIVIEKPLVVTKKFVGGRKTAKGGRKKAKNYF